NDGTVTHAAVLQHTAVPKLDVAAHQGFTILAGVDDYVFLHGGALADADAAVIAAQARAHAHKAGRADDDVADDVGAIGHKGAGMDGGALAFEFVEGHKGRR